MSRFLSLSSPRRPPRDAAAPLSAGWVWLSLAVLALAAALLLAQVLPDGPLRTLERAVEAAGSQEPVG